MIYDIIVTKEMTYKGLRDKLLSDLNKLIRAFEIYLADYVEKIKIEEISPNIIKAIEVKKTSVSGNVKYISSVYSKVLNFNYTNTCERAYLKDLKEKSDKTIDYIHGKADNSRLEEIDSAGKKRHSNIKEIIESNNMVLGIDEYLKKKERNKQVILSKDT